MIFRWRTDDHDVRDGIELKGIFVSSSAEIVLLIESQDARSTRRLQDTTEVKSISAIQTEFHVLNFHQTIFVLTYLSFIPLLQLQMAQRSILHGLVY